jgi:hypothetical protein
MMIHKLVQSAFMTGVMSVESEALIRQVLAWKVYQPSDLKALHNLYQAINNGAIQREANGIFNLQLPAV